MKIPPKLTKREREILPFVAAGETRSQIAKKFDISEDTVKAHIRNIVTKFDAVTVRDGIGDFWEYLEMFSDDGLGYKFYVNLVTNHVKLDGVTGDGKLTRTHHIVTIEDGQTELEDVFALPGGIGASYIDGVEAKPYLSQLNKQFFKKHFKEPLPENSEVSVTFEVEQLKCYTADVEYNFSRINHPTYEMVLVIEFPKDRPCIEAWPEGRISAMPLKLPANAFKFQDGVAELRIIQPQLGGQYLIHWRW